MHPDIEKVLFTEEEVHQRVKELADQINRDYAGTEVVLVCILRGSYIFTADLSRYLTVPTTIDFMSVSSYGSGTVSTGAIQVKKDLSDDPAGKHLILVEDILDTGNTLFALKNLLLHRKAASIRICTLLNKPSRREKSINADYVGYEVPNSFVVGYGMDYNEHYRNLPFVGVLKPSVYGGE